MSLILETDLEEYARQCTVQRRHYEACTQQAQPSSMVDANSVQASTSAHDVVAGAPLDAPQLDRCLDDTTQSCMIDLLELAIEPLAWEDRGSEETRYSSTEERQAHGDRSQVTHETVSNPTGKSVNSMSYGAP